MVELKWSDGLTDWSIDRNETKMCEKQEKKYDV